MSTLELGTRIAVGLVALPAGLMAFVTGIWLWFAVAACRQNRNWPRTDGRVVQSRSVDNRKCGVLWGWHWRVDCEFAIPFEVAARWRAARIATGGNASEESVAEDADPPDELDLIGSAVAMSRFPYLTRKASERVVQTYRPGESVQVAYDPQYPGSTIRPGLTADLAYPGTLFLFSAAAATALVLWSLH